MPEKRHAQLPEDQEYHGKDSDVEIIDPGAHVSSIASIGRKTSRSTERVPCRESKRDYSTVGAKLWRRVPKNVRRLRRVTDRRPA